MVCDTAYLQNEISDPRFYYVFNLILSFSTYSQSFKKICTWEVLGANVLKLKIDDLTIYRKLHAAKLQNSKIQPYPGLA